MDKDSVISTMNHNVTLTDRKNIMITGVKKIDSFDEEEFLMNTTMGYLTLKGEGLEIIKLDTFQGTVSIKGKINSFLYMDKDKKEKEEGVFGKLFK